MKKQFTMLSLFVFVTANLTSCKKDTTSLKARMIGKWTVNRIEVSGDPDQELNGNFVYNQADYMDFKSNTDDQVELSLDGQRTIGSYTTSANDFAMVLPEGDVYCSVRNISSGQFQFVAKTDKTNITKVYYLSR